MKRPAKSIVKIILAFVPSAVWREMCCVFGAYKVVWKITKNKPYWRILSMGNK